MTIDNVSAAVSLVKVAQASQQLITVASGYAKGVTNSSKFHIQLESQLQRIVAASNLALGAVNKSSSLSNDPDIDPRLVEWLSSNEPDKCLDTLKAMQRLLQDRPLSQQLFSIIPSVSKHEGFHQAITLFNEHRANFHFLLTMDIWNNGKGGQRHKEAPNGPVDIDEGSKNVQRGQSEVGGGRTTIGNKLSVGRRERKKEVDRKDVERFLRWLNGLTCTRKHEDTCALRQAETCTWLPETETYQSWRCGDSPFLWLKGKPGSGKSVLASSVIDQLKSSLRDGEVLAFFYCDFRNERSTSAAEVMRSLLTQLLRLANADGVDCRDAVPELVERKAEGTEPPCDMKLLTCLVRHVAQQLHRQPLIVIDALDECKDAEKLVHAVKQLNDGHIRVFVTSRPERIIMETLFDLPSISLQNMGGAVSADMKRHITIKLDSRQWLRILKPALKQEIHFALLARADGMFRWVQCQIDMLAKCTSAGEIQSTLKSLPDGLDETYERILVTADQNELQGKLVRRVLVWLVAALEPRCLPDIMEALKIDLERRTSSDDIVPLNKIILLDACGSLVTYNSQRDIITLSHFSVKEYLTGELVRTQLPHYYIHLQDAHEQLARVCMCYMSLLGHSSKSITDKRSSSCLIPKPALLSDKAEASSDEDESFDARLLSHGLVHYALFNGFGHLAHLGWEHDWVLDDLKALQADIQQSPRKWKQIRDKFGLRPYECLRNWSDSKHDFMLYILVRFASVSLLERYLDHAALIPNAGTNPLIYAVHFDKAQHAQTLLSRGARVNDIGWAVEGSWQALPLEVAVKKEAIGLVDLLLAAGSRVPELLFKNSVSPTETVPLCVVRSLLRTDEFVEWVVDCRDKQTLLHNVLRRDYVADEEDIMVDITRRLIQVGCDPAGYKSSLRPEVPLDITVAQGHVLTAKYLISEHIQMPSDILLAVARAWKNPARMMSMFIDQGADIHMCMSNGDSVLHVAINQDLTGFAGVLLHEPQGLLETVKILIDSGCNPALCNSDGKTPLHVAVFRGHISVVEYMLSLDIPLPTDILLAGQRARANQVEVIRMLIGRGADIHARTFNGDTVLHAAAASLGSDEWDDAAWKTFKVLINAGCDPSTRNSDDKTALHIAANRGHTPAVEYMLSPGRVRLPLPADILLAAVGARWGNRAKIIKMLIDRGADVHAHTSDGGSILHAAMALPDFSVGGPLKTVKMLVNAGCDPSTCNSDGKMLHIAAAYGHISIVEYMLSLGVPLPADILLAGARTLLQREKMIKMLIAKGADVHALTSNGDTALHVSMNHLGERDDAAFETAKALIEAGCDAAACNSDGKMALHIAAANGYASAVEYVVSLDIPLSSDILLAAARAGCGNPAKVTMIKMLIEKGADVHAHTSDGDTVLHVSLHRSSSWGEAAFETAKAAKVLIEAGCDLATCNSDGKTPLHVAALGGHIFVVEYMLSLNILLPSDILLAAARASHNRAKIIKMLIDKGADVHARTSDGSSILHVTLHQDTLRESSVDGKDLLEAVEILVHSGCSPIACNANGKMPIHVAVAAGHLSAVQHLLVLSQGVPLPSDILFATMGTHSSKQEEMRNILISEGADPSTCALARTIPPAALLPG